MNGLLKGFVVGVICVVLTVGAFAFARAGAGDNTLYLPALRAGGVASDPGGGTLANGGIVVGPDGVGLGALDDTLQEPVEVTIARTSAPATALPTMAHALGDYYTLAVTEEVIVSPERPLIAAFPVPPGADSEHLVLAMLASGDRVHDAQPGQDGWLFLEGFYNADDDLFLTTLAGLMAEAEGRTFVLTSHPDFESPPNQATAPAAGSPESSLIQAKCVHFSNPTHCTSSIETQVETFVTNVYGHIKQNKQFAEPRLRYLHETLDYNPNSLSSLGYMMYIEPHDHGWCASLPAIGYFDATEGYLALCYNPLRGLNDDAYSALVHEFFHATQYAYQPVLDDWKNGREETWFIEGMAMSAENSYNINEMKRTEAGGWVELHLVDQSLALATDPEAYFAQDFWVYHGLSSGEDLAYLRSLLSQGSETADVATVLGDGERLTPYWEWAKNQAIEKQHTFDNRLQNPCHLQADVVQNLEIFEHDYPNKLEHQVTVGPLTTVVVKLTFKQDWGFAAGEVYAHLVAQLPGAEQALKYKFYEDGLTGCANVPDGMRIWPWGEGVYAGRVYYVLISNTDIDETYDYTVILEIGN